MKKNRRIGGFAIFIILFIVIGAIALATVYWLREKQKREFDELLNVKAVLSVDYGVIPREHKLKEKNALLSRTVVENYTYLVINEDNVIYEYYTDWYYNIDPMKGYKLEMKKTLTKKNVEKILDYVNEHKIDTLSSTVKSDYVTIRIDGETYYMTKHDIQMALDAGGVLYNPYDI